MNRDPMNPAEPTTTGRFIVTFREGAHAEARAMLQSRAGLAAPMLMSSADFEERGVDVDQLAQASGAVFEHLGMAVVDVEPTAAGAIAMEAGEDSPILAIEPEGIMYPLG